MMGLARRRAAFQPVGGATVLNFEKNDTVVELENYYMN